VSNNYKLMKYGVLTACHCCSIFSRPY